MIILVNGEEKSLSIIDRESGCDWIRDLLGNNDALHYDEELDVHTMDKDEYDWWAKYIEGVEEYESYADELIEEGYDPHEVQKAINEGHDGCDMEDWPGNVMENLRALAGEE